MRTTNKHWSSWPAPIPRRSASSTGAICPACMRSPIAAPGWSRRPRTSPRPPSSARSAAWATTAGGQAGSGRGCSGSRPTSSSTTTGGRAAPRRPGPSAPRRGSTRRSPSIRPSSWPCGMTSRKCCAAMDRLSPRYQQALALRYLAGLTPGEAAAAMGVSRATMAVVVHRATRALRKALEAEGGRERRHPPPARGRRRPPGTRSRPGVRRRPRGAPACGRGGLPPAHLPPPRVDEARARPAGGRLGGSRSSRQRWSSPSACRSSAPAPRPAPRRRWHAPVNVEVALADGTMLEDPDGLVLPEGAVVTVGEGGSARIGDTVLSPGDVATMRDGRLDVEGPPVGALATPDRSPRPTDRPVTPSPSTRPDATPAPAPTRTPDRTPAATAPPTGQPGTTAKPATATPTRDARDHHRPAAAPGPPDRADPASP